MSTASSARCAPHLAAHLEPVHPGQTQVEDEQIELAGAAARSSAAGPVLFDGHRVSLTPEGPRQRGGDGLVVFGQQYGGHAFRLTATVGPMAAVGRFNALCVSFRVVRPPGC